MNLFLSLFLSTALATTLALAAWPAHADVGVTGKILQKGVFSPKGCDGSPECLCEADISYPVISGMKDENAQNALNAGFLKSAQQLACQGESATPSGKENNFSISHRYEVTLQTPRIISFKFTDWAYEGGAHGNGAVEGVIIDLENGKVLGVNDLFAANSLAAVNRVIYDTLAPKSDGIFRDEIEKRKGTFIKEGKCQGCTLVADKNGVQVIFQAYEVAPFADGNPSVVIPVQYIASPAASAFAASR